MLIAYEKNTLTQPAIMNFWIHSFHSASDSMYVAHAEASSEKFPRLVLIATKSW